MRDLRGAAPAAVRAALRAGDPLPGLDGFAGRLPDGRLVRDVLGRRPLYVDGAAWSHDHRALADPSPVPAGAVGDPGGPLRRALTLPTVEPVAGDTGLRTLETAVDRALAAVPEDVPVGFSGGVDSGLVATATDGPAYVVGLPDSPDVAAAREGAAAMGRDLRVVELDLETLAESVPTVARAAGTVEPLDLAIALCLYHLGRAVAADGYDRVALGQGADELFAGYQKVAEAPTDDRVTADTVEGARDEVLASIPEQVCRDHGALRTAGVEPVTPLLADGVVAAARQLPTHLLVADGRRKVGLRTVARRRLPEVVAGRDKRALQYGSRTSRELDRLARQAGFKRREDDHVRRYVRARLEGDAGEGAP